MLETIMRSASFGSGAWALCLALCCLALSLAPRTASAAPKQKARPAAHGKTPKKNPKKAAPEAATPDADDQAAEGDDTAAAKPEKGEPSGVKAAGTSAGTPAPNAAGAVAVKETKETKEGVKTYKFGTIEVEGRMKSPQIIYFLRRVRAEFDAGALGHRSFMRELSDTRNNPSLR